MPAVPERNAHLTLEEINVIHFRDISACFLVKICKFFADFILEKMPCHHLFHLIRGHFRVKDSLRFHQDDRTHGTCAHTSGYHDLHFIGQPEVFHCLNQCIPHFPAVR